MRMNQVTVPVQNLQQAADFYQLLGLKIIVNSPHYMRFVCPEGDSTLSIEQVDAKPGKSAVVIYFETDHLDQKVRELTAAGLVFHQEPVDQPWLWREAYLEDPSGNRICLYHAGENRLNPPWKVK